VVDVRSNKDEADKVVGEIAVEGWSLPRESAKPAREAIVSGE